jgi:hypothetical protein
VGQSAAAPTALSALAGVGGSVGSGYAPPTGSAAPAARALQRPGGADRQRKRVQLPRLTCCPGGHLGGSCDPEAQSAAHEWIAHGGGAHLDGLHLADPCRAEERSVARALQSPAVGAPAAAGGGEARLMQARGRSEAVPWRADGRWRCSGRGWCPADDDVPSAGALCRCCWCVCGVCVVACSVCGVLSRPRASVTPCSMV